jgi:hypothetical protein
MLLTKPGFNNILNSPDAIAGKYGAFFQERSIDPLQAQPSFNNENELLAFGLPGASGLIGRGLKRAHNVAKQYTANIHGLAVADKVTSKDPLNEHLMHLMLSGGSLALPALGARILNAGATNAGTLDEAKRLGYYTEK